jgi:hypothetical protein
MTAALIPSNTSPFDALGVVVGLEQERRNRPEQYRPTNARRAVLAEVAGHLAGAHREADEHDVVKAELLEQRVEVGGEGVVVVARGGPAGVAEAAPVVPDDAAAGAEKLGLLTLPRVGVERIAVDQDDRHAAAVVLVVNLDVAVVLAADTDVGHWALLPLLGEGEQRAYALSATLGHVHHPGPGSGAERLASSGARLRSRWNR